MSAARALRACAAAAWLALASGCSGALLAAANGLDAVGGGYRRIADVAYGADPRQRLDVYVPAAAGPARSVVVFFHGGRWSRGSKDQYRFVAAGLAAAGHVVVVPNYRLYPAVHLPDALADAAAAVAWTEAHAARYGGDPARVVVTGHSAGAHLAALVAFDRAALAAAGGQPVAGFAGFAGPYDFLPLTDADLIDYFGPPERFPASQPVAYVAAGAPPAFLVHGTADTDVKPRNTDALARRLADVGTPVEVYRPAGEGHGDVLRRFARPSRGADPVYGALLAFLDRIPARAAPVAAGAGGAGTR